MNGSSGLISPQGAAWTLAFVRTQQDHVLHELGSSLSVSSMHIVISLSSSCTDAAAPTPQGSTSALLPPGAKLVNQLLIQEQASVVGGDKRV